MATPSFGKGTSRESSTTRTTVSPATDGLRSETRGRGGTATRGRGDAETRGENGTGGLVLRSEALLRRAGRGDGGGKRRSPAARRCEISKGPAGATPPPTAR